jgi:hypothetical protein
MKRALVTLCLLGASPAWAQTKQTDAVTATVMLAAATRVTIGGVKVDPAGVVTFVTTSQRSTRGFNLYETDSPRGKGDVEPITSDLVVAPKADANAPILYRVRTRALTKRYVLIEELEYGGRRHMLGPYDSQGERSGRAVDRMNARMDAAGIPDGDTRIVTSRHARRMLDARDRASGARLREWKGRRPSRQSDAVRIAVEQPGVVRIPASQLRANGITVNPRLRLTSGGVAVPYRIEPGTDERYLVFEASALRTDFSRRSVYVLSEAGAAQYPMAVGLTRSGDPTRAGWYRVEKTRTYVPNVREDADPFLWDLLWTWVYEPSGQSDETSWPGEPYFEPGTEEAYCAANWVAESYWWQDEAQCVEWYKAYHFNGIFDVPGLLPGAGAIPVRIALVGWSEHSHAVAAKINGVDVGSATIEGAAKGVLTGTIPAGVLKAAGNRLTLTYTASTEDATRMSQYTSLYLDYVEVQAPLGPDTTPIPASAVTLEAYDGRLPALKGVQYLIVTHPMFRAQADAIASLKANEGLQAAVVETDNVYDRFSGGIVEAQAIRAAIRHASQQSGGALRYVLLVGDDFYDAADYQGLGPVSFVPSLYGWDGSRMWGRVPSENRYADIDGDNLPDVSIGRLPVQTVEEAQAMVEKIAHQAETLAALVDRNVFAAEIPNVFRDDDLDYGAEAREMAALLNDQQVALADVAQGVEQARAVLIGGWQTGTGMIHYFGHGGWDSWSNLSLLDSGDVADLASARPTVLFAWACMTQGFAEPYQSLNEGLVLLPTGGAAAAFGPAGVSSPAIQRRLYRAVYERIANSGVTTLGEALRRSKVETLRKDPGALPVVEGFNLLGDPALQLPVQVR